MRFATGSSFIVLISQIYLSTVAATLPSGEQDQTNSNCMQLNMATHAPDTWDWYITLEKREIAQTDESPIDVHDGDELKLELLSIFRNCENNLDLSKESIKVDCQGDKCIVGTSIPSRCAPNRLTKFLNENILDKSMGYSLKCATQETCIKAPIRLQLGSKTSSTSYRIEKWGGGTIWQIRLRYEGYKHGEIASSICNDIWNALQKTTHCQPFPSPFPRECKWNYQLTHPDPDYYGDALVIRVVMPDICDAQQDSMEVANTIAEVTTRHGTPANLNCVDLELGSFADTDDLWLRPFGQKIKDKASSLRENRPGS